MRIKTLGVKASFTYLRVEAMPAILIDLMYESICGRLKSTSVVVGLQANLHFGGPS